jgi:YVTN family beta-propeller protein
MKNRFNSWLICALAVSLTATAQAQLAHFAKIGAQPDGSYIVPTNQRLTPTGKSITAAADRPVSLAIRPDGLTAAFINETHNGPDQIVVIDLVDGQQKQIYTNNFGSSLSGLLYSADGTKLYSSHEYSGNVVVSDVAADGTLTFNSNFSIQTQANVPPFPAGLAQTADGKRLCVVANVYNNLDVVDLATQTILAEIPVGNAPFTVRVVGNYAYVTNQGGRPALPGDFTNYSAGTPIVADPRSGGVTTGTVSIVDLASYQVVKTLNVGLQPTEMVTQGNYLLVTNTNSDSISVIDTRTQEVIDTFPVQVFPGAPFGTLPNSVAFVDPADLLVTLGGANAVAQYTWFTPYRRPVLKGLIPTGWYPCEVNVSQPTHQIVVANTKGIGSLGDPITVQIPGVATVTGPNTYSWLSVASLIPFQTDAQLRLGLLRVMENNGWAALPKNENSSQSSGKGDPIPTTLGQSSPIKHVIYIVKENRTFDQVFGDDPRGNGDSSFAQFGGAATPNQHALAADFPLLDNFFDCGLRSSDGHQWCVQGMALDYIERPGNGDSRSYPYNGGDALAYSPTGFIWQNALDHQKSVRGYGEYSNQFTLAPNVTYGSWTDWYRDSQILEGKIQGTLHVPLGSAQASSDVPAWDQVLNRDYPGFDTNIPDQYRTDIFLREFQGYVANDNLPNLVIMTLCNDHTGGLPQPIAQVADNDLALGRIVDAVSHSKFWASTAIFVVEDDTQSGVDHVEGHRGPVLVVSPYARRGGYVDHHFYTQLNVLRTIEQILGLPPLNIRDAAVEPMLSCFGRTPDLRPFTAVPNQIPLDEMRTAAVTPMQKAWREADIAMFQGHPKADSQDANLLNHSIWYQCTNFTRPYPGESRVLWPKELGAATTDRSGDVDND